MARAPFGPDRQDRFFEALGRGETVAAAARFAPVAGDTVYRWLRLGRAAQAPPEQAAFARRYERATAPPTGRLSESDLLDMLEQAARKGSVGAVKLLLEERRRKPSRSRRQRRPRVAR